MSATDELRRLLDEHGVEHKDSDDNLVYNYTTSWSIGRCNVEYSEYRSGVTRMVATCISPEQAVEATVGRDMCHMMSGEYSGSVHYDLYECSECGEQIPRTKFMGESTPPKYCPECGKRVVG